MSAGGNMNNYQLKENYPKVEQLKEYLNCTGADEIDLVAVCMNLCDHIQNLERRLNKGKCNVCADEIRKQPESVKSYGQILREAMANIDTQR